MIITISGLPGAGKTSVAKELAKRLGFDFVSVGEIRGEIALGLGVTIEELNTMGTESDRLADAKQIELGQSGKNIIIEGRTSWYFIPDSFKILITVEPREGARRIYEDIKNNPRDRADERAYVSVDDALQSIANRVASDKRRLGGLYGVENFSDPKHFDFVLDTTNSSGSTENADKIIEEMKKRKLIGE